MTRAPLDLARRARPASGPDPFAPAHALLDFALLGLLAEGPLHFRCLLRLVPRLTAPHVQPVADVLRRRVEHLFERGSVFIETRDDKPGTEVVHLSPAGRDHFLALMTRRVGESAGSTGNRLLTLATCVLDLVDEASRRGIIDALIRERRAQLEHLQHSAGTDLPRHRFVRRCLAHELAELEREIRWLESLLTIESGSPRRFAGTGAA